jgi:hypothetical protein
MVIAPQSRKMHDWFAYPQWFAKRGVHIGVFSLSLLLVCVRPHTATANDQDSIPTLSQDSAVYSAWRPLVGFNLELMGPAQVALVNCEAFILPPRTVPFFTGAGISVGAGYSVYAPSFTPVIDKALFGSEHMLEMGAGLLVKIKEQLEGTTFRQWSDSWYHLGAHIGYRYQPIDGGLYYRVCLWLTRDVGTGWTSPSPGLSIGYCF